MAPALLVQQTVSNAEVLPSVMCASKDSLGPLSMKTNRLDKSNSQTLALPAVKDAQHAQESQTHAPAVQPHSISMEQDVSVTITLSFRSSSMLTSQTTLETQTKVTSIPTLETGLQSAMTVEPTTLDSVDSKADQLTSKLLSVSTLEQFHSQLPRISNQPSTALDLRFFPHLSRLLIQTETPSLE